MISDDGFIRWLANGVRSQPARLKQLLKENKTNTRNTKFGEEDFQEIYDFWLQKCINSSKSFYNLAKITKRSFLEQYSNIRHTNLIEKHVKMKHSSKSIYTAREWFTLNQLGSYMILSINLAQQLFRYLLSSNTNPTIACDQQIRRNKAVCA